MKRITIKSASASALTLIILMSFLYSCSESDDMATKEDVESLISSKGNDFTILKYEKISDSNYISFENIEDFEKFLDESLMPSGPYELNTNNKRGEKEYLTVEGGDEGGDGGGGGGGSSSYNSDYNYYKYSYNSYSLVITSKKTDTDSVESYLTGRTVGIDYNQNSFTDSKQNGNRQLSIEGYIRYNVSVAGVKSHYAKDVNLSVSN
ncbi:MAG: hypothetical protein HRT66_03540 [Flavobacteriaceae bacterium]|nr:hypothetical protein [Flavobacteriaceae bacterium]